MGRSRQGREGDPVRVSGGGSRMTAWAKPGRSTACPGPPPAEGVPLADQDRTDDRDVNGVWGVTGGHRGGLAVRGVAAFGAPGDECPGYDARSPSRAESDEGRR